MERRRHSNDALTVFWDGNEAQLEAAKRTGRPLTVVCFGLEESADSVEEAEEMVRRHRESGARHPITVYRRAERDRVLAAWDPGLPEWLGGAAMPAAH